MLRGQKESGDSIPIADNLEPLRVLSWPLFTSLWKSGSGNRGQVLQSCSIQFTGDCKTLFF